MVPGHHVRLLETETGEEVMQYVLDLAAAGLLTTVVAFAVTFGIGAGVVALIRVFFRD